MSKGLSPLKLGYAPQRHLPFVVVRSVPRSGTWLLLASDVKAKVLNPVVGLVAVHVVNKLTGRKRPSKVHGHNPSVFKNGLSFALHRPKHRKQVRADIARSREVVSITSNASNIVTTSGDVPTMLSQRDGHQSAWPAKPLEMRTHRLATDFRGRALSILKALRTPDGDHNPRSILVAPKVGLANHARRVNRSKNRYSGQFPAPVLKRVSNIPGAARHRNAVTPRRCPYV